MHYLAQYRCKLRVMFRTMNNRITYKSTSPCCCLHIQSAELFAIRHSSHFAFHIDASEHRRSFCVFMSAMKPNFSMMICALLMQAATAEGFLRYVPKKASIVQIKQPPPSLRKHSNHLYGTITGEIDVCYSNRVSPYCGASKGMKTRYQKINLKNLIFNDLK